MKKSNNDIPVSICVTAEKQKDRRAIVAGTPMLVDLFAVRSSISL